MKQPTSVVGFIAGVVTPPSRELTYLVFPQKSDEGESTLDKNISSVTLEEYQLTLIIQTGGLEF